MRCSAAWWPLVAVLLSGAAAYISLTPEPPGATILDPHWPYAAPDNGYRGWRWRTPRRQHWHWRTPRAELAQTPPEPNQEQQPGPEQEQEPEQEPKKQDQQQLNQHQEHQEQDHVREQDDGEWPGGDESPLHSWPEFSEVPDHMDDTSDLLSRQRRKHGRPQRWKMQRLCEERGECTCYSARTSATFCCDCQWGSCFPAAADAVLADGRRRRMDRLAAGDRVLTVSATGELVPTTVLGFLDRRPTAAGEYHHVTLASGHTLRLSGGHVTFARRRPEGLFAEELRIGDEMRVQAGNGTAVYSAVVRVTHHVMTGAFVPLTEHGTLLVDGVLASNYASFSHGLSHALTAPFRLWPALLSSEWLVVREKNVLVAALKSLGKTLLATPTSGPLRLM